MKKKKLNNRLLLNKKTISNLEVGSAGAIKGGQTGKNCGSHTDHNHGCLPHSIVHTCNHSDVRNCTAETFDVCLTVICG